MLVLSSTYVLTLTSALNLCCNHPDLITGISCLNCYTALHFFSHTHASPSPKPSSFPAYGLCICYSHSQDVLPPTLACLLIFRLQSKCHSFKEPILITLSKISLPSCFTSQLLVCFLLDSLLSPGFLYSRICCCFLWLEVRGPVCPVLFFLRSD